VTAKRTVGAGDGLLLVAGLLLALALAWTGPTLERLTEATLLFSAWFVLLLVLVFRRGAVLDRPGVLLGSALLLRAIFLPTVPDLSVDPFRYVWDGWLTASGMNPYRYVPSDPALVHLHDEPLFRGMNSREFYTIYPPLSQWLFAPAGAVYDRWGWPHAFLALKGTVVLAEVAGILLLARAASHMGVRLRYLGLYALNPLVVVTVAGVGHSEGGLLLGLGLLALGLARGGGVLAWTGLGLATVSKGLPLLLAPLLVRHHLERLGTARMIRTAALGSLPALALSLPFFFPGLPGRIGASANLYVRLFEFNAGLHALLVQGLGALGVPHPAQVSGPLLRIGFILAALWVWLRHPARRPLHVLAGLLLLFGIYLATATTVHPWYLLWGLALIPLVHRHRGAWLWASWAGFLTYFAYIGVPAAAVATLFWSGVFLLVAWEEWPRIRLPLLRLAGRRKARLIAPHLEGTSVLDLGAGEGFVGDRLARMGRSVVLAEIEPSFEVALPGLLFDGVRLPLGDGAVDTVVLSLVLHHAADPDRLMREALRVARLRVVITESTYRWRWERRLLELADRGVNRGRGRGPGRWREEPLRFDTPQGWESRIQAAGGRVHTSRRLNRIGHRHHIFVVDPPAGAASVQISPNRRKSSDRSPPAEGTPPPRE
jgi:SAM-dependent methyltransferase